MMMMKCCDKIYVDENVELVVDLSLKFIILFMYFQICLKICEERNNLHILFCWFVINFHSLI